MRIRTIGRQTQPGTTGNEVNGENHNLLLRVKRQHGFNDEFSGALHYPIGLESDFSPDVEIN